MSSLLEETFRFDEIGAHNGLTAYLQQEPRDTSEVLYIVYQMLLGSRFKGAYYVAKTLGPIAYTHPITALGIALGGLLFGSGEDELRGRIALSGTVDHLDAAKQASIYNDILSKTIPNIVNHVFLRDETAVLLRLLEILKAGIPLFREVFDYTPRSPSLDIEAMRRTGRERASLIAFPGPPPGTPREARRGVVAIRKHYLGATDEKLSRPADIGPRIMTAMNAYGWPTQFFGMTFSDPQADYRGIAALCRETDADVVVLDDNLIQNGAIRRMRAEFIAQLRWELPKLKVVSVYLDPWVFTPAEIIETSAMADAVMSVAPTMPVWRHPLLARKAFLAPFPIGVEPPQPPAALRPVMTFAGGVMGYNWHRALWLGVAKHFGLPIERQLTTHTPDGLSALESYAHYIQRLAAATCSLNFSMRSDLSKVSTARTFETISCGALLVEEWSTDIDHYFVSGEHYLSFSNFHELRAVANFLETEPEAANAIRKRGAAFFKENYSDEKLIGNLDLRLFHTHGELP